MDFVQTVRDELTAASARAADPEQLRARLVKRLEAMVAERDRVVARYDAEIRRQQAELDAIEKEQREARAAATAARGKKGRK